MARKTTRRTSKAKREREKQKRLALTLVGAVAVLLLCALTLAVPGFSQWLSTAAGITPAMAPPATGVDSPVAIHFVDVGQGTASLVEDGGEFALIDAGPPEGADALVAYLKGAGVTRLRYLVMTHPHADHYGGMQKVVENFEVERVVLPRLELAPYPTAITFLDLLAAIDKRGIAAEEAAMGAVYPLGQGEITVVHTGVATEDNYNLLSLGLLYAGDGLRFLATGDGEKANERAMLESGADLRAEVFSAAHHGSSTSNTEGFLQAVGPQVVVISCAAGNSYGHPHKSALGAYADVGARVYRTDKDGSVVVQPDGGRMAVGLAKGPDDAA